MDDMAMKHVALGNIRKMLKNGRAKKLGALGAPKPEAPPEATSETKPAGKPTALEIHAIKLAPVEGSPEEEAGESPAEAAAEGDEHPVHKALKKLNQIIRPR